jgi:arsenate reductase
MSKKKVLFLCTHNSARSQMAEGILRALYGDHYEVYSAGTHPTGVSSYAVKVMAEINIDISQHTPKSIERFKQIPFDYVITLCDTARDTCPFFPGAKELIHKGFQDPSQFTSSPLEALAHFRKVRDEINDWIKKTFDKEN